MKQIFSTIFIFFITIIFISLLLSNSLNFIGFGKEFQGYIIAVISMIILSSKNEFFIETISEAFGGEGTNFEKWHKSLFQNNNLKQVINLFYIIFLIYSVYLKLENKELFLISNPYITKNNIFEILSTYFFINSYLEFSSNKK